MPTHQTNQKGKPLSSLTSDFHSVIISYRSSQLSEQRVRFGIYLKRPETADIIPSENRTFTTRVEPVSPPSTWVICTTKDGGGAGYCPRVHYAYSVKRLSP
jgi:hypothetical protein